MNKTKLIVKVIGMKETVKTNGIGKIQMTTTDDKCNQCIHSRSVTKEITRIYCHRELHSLPKQYDSLGYYPLVATIEQDGIGWSCGTCSFFKRSY